MWLVHSLLLKVPLAKMHRRTKQLPWHPTEKGRGCLRIAAQKL